MSSTSTSEQVASSLNEEEKFTYPATPVDPEIPTVLDMAGKSAPPAYEPEWTFSSSLQVLGGFMLLFNS
jgi:hypothetical protein